MDGEITIIQYNCGHANYGASRPIFDAASPASHMVLAIQEPCFSKVTRTTYCPKGYTLAYIPNPATKVCFMVSKEIYLGHWSFQAHSPYVASLCLRTIDNPLTIINVYNPRGDGPRIQTWDAILEALAEAEGEVLLLGDFNAHHPEWGGTQAASEPQSRHLLVETGKKGLQLLTPRGEPTWKRGMQQSVIDLTFATERILNTILYCGPEERWAITKDHIPINIRLSIATTPPPPSRRYALQKLNKKKLHDYLKESKWESSSDPLSTLQEALQKGLELHCPKAKPSTIANKNWSPRASELLAGARRARRQYSATRDEHHRQAQHSYQNLLKKELRRAGRNSWRRFIEEVTSDPTRPHNQGLWKLAKWSKRNASGPQGSQQIPPLRRNDQEQVQKGNKEKAQILAERFFPRTGQADLSDITGQQPTGTNPEQREFNISHIVTKEEVEKVIKRLPNGKATGPDNVPYEVLKEIAPQISEGLAQAFTKQLASGTLPRSFKDSITTVLRKERKKDYSLPSSYRPIALENSLAKVLEKIVANRIAQAAEEHNLLSWNQIGARKKRSTLSAIDLLTACVQTAWRARPGCVVSMLSLDISGAYDHVSHERLLWTLSKKGMPQWVVNIIQSFLKERRTRITFPGHESNWIETETGIPQGSPLSPILFIFFITELLEEFQRADSETLAFGFIDDTNLVTWGDSAKENCQRLERAHEKCIAWSARHGTHFAPDKYQLIHFTKRRRDASGDLASTLRINSHQVKPETKLRVLGVWVDPKMNWKEHTSCAAQKGLQAYEALSRITASTWGPSMRRSRLIYTAVVRPAMMYGAQAWAVRDNGELAANSLLKPLKAVQRKCLQRITGGYKRTPTAALEREAQVPPLDLYTDTIALQRALATKHYPINQNIAEVANRIWNQGANNRPLPNAAQTQRQR